MSDVEAIVGQQRARRIGAVVQGLVLGALLAVAIILLAAMSSSATVFRYQGF